METKKGQAIETICLYRPNEKVFIAEVFDGEIYEVPIEVEVFIGTKEQFLTLNPDYEFETEIIEEL